MDPGALTQGRERLRILFLGDSRVRQLFGSVVELYHGDGIKVHRCNSRVANNE